jgi:hypothetical protein
MNHYLIDLSYILSTSNIRLIAFSFGLSYIYCQMRSKFCLSSTTSFEKINKAATNRSITKQTFTFSRSSRFDPPKAKYTFPYAAVPSIPTVGISWVSSLQEHRSAMAKSQISLVV